MWGIGVPAVIMAAAHGGHQAPAGWLLALLIVLVLLYVAMRTGRLRRVRTAVGAWRMRGALRGVRVGPMALVPTAVLLIVIVVLLLSHH